MAPYCEPRMWVFDLEELPRRGHPGDAFYVGTLRTGPHVVLWRRGGFRDVVNGRPL